MGMNPWYKFYGELYRCMTGRPWVPGLKFEGVNFVSKIDIVPRAEKSLPQKLSNDEYYLRDKRRQMKPPVIIYSASDNFIVPSDPTEALKGLEEKPPLK